MTMNSDCFRRISDRLGDTQTESGLSRMFLSAANEIDILVDALKRYGKHDVDCMANLTRDKDCTCGLDDVTEDLE